MIPKKKNSLSDKLIIHSQSIADSFVDQKIYLTNNQIKQMEKFLGNNIIQVTPIKTRKLYVSIVDSYDFDINFSDSNNLSNAITRQVLFYPFIVQSSFGLFLVISSTFNIYDFLDREPYRESIGEYRYQAQLAKALGLKNAVAYDIPANLSLSDDTVVKDDLEIMYCSDDDFSYLIYSL